MSTRNANRLARIWVAVLLITAPALAQQKYVTRFDAYLGYGYLNSPAISLPENGVHFQFGVRPITRFSIGFDYMNATGDATITPGLLLNPLQQQLGAQLRQLVLAGVIPANYSLVVPAHSETQTFTVGPQLAFRHFEAVTFFLRPCIGRMREVVTAKPGDAIATGIVNGLKAQNLLPANGRKIDWTNFYGAGGGIDLNFTHHVALRIQGDLVWDHLYPDLLQNGRKTVRFSIGPAFNFGKNIVRQ